MKTLARSTFGLHGLLPPHVESLDAQVVRAYEAYQRKDDDLERHIYLRALQDTNEVLFYRLLLDHIEDMTPMVYTPVVALACQQFSHIYRRPRGLFISYPLRDSIPTLLRIRPNPEGDVMVVTDGERILGIGDQEAGGLGIPIGKLSLYTLIGGIRPERTLPIVLDVGTNNAARLHDPEYLGWRPARVTGQAYVDFIDQFVQAVKQELPGTCVQWEDFATPHARPIPITSTSSRPSDSVGSASGARRVTDTIILAAARALAEHSPARQDASASLLPALADLRQVAVHIAIAVGLEAQTAGMAPKATEEELRQRVMATQWTPAYPSFATATM